jgi:hypothetical protein
MPRRHRRRKAMMFAPMRRHMRRRRFAHSPSATVSGMLLYSGGGLLGIQSASLLHRAIVTVDPASTTFKLPAGVADITTYNENVVHAKVPWSSVGAQLGLAFAGGLMGWAVPWGWLKMLMYGFSSGATLHVGTQLIDAYIVEPLIVKMGASAAAAATAANTPVVQTRGQRYYQHEIDAGHLLGTLAGPPPSTTGAPPRDRRGAQVRALNARPTRMPSALAYASTLGDQGNMVPVAADSRGNCPPGAMDAGPDPSNLDVSLCFVPAPEPPRPPPMTSNMPPPPAQPPPYVPPSAGPPPAASPPPGYAAPPPPAGVVPPRFVPTPGTTPAAARPTDESCRLPREQNTPCCGDKNVCTCGSCMGEPPREPLNPLMAQLQRARKSSSMRSRFAA